MLWTYLISLPSHASWHMFGRLVQGACTVICTARSLWYPYMFKGFYVSLETMWDLDGSAVRKIDEWCIFLAVIRQDPLWQCRAMRFNDWNNTGSYFMELDLLTFAGFNRKVSNVNAEITWVLNVHERLLGNEWLHDCIHFLAVPLQSGSKLYTRRHQGRICRRQSAQEPAKGHYVKLYYQLKHWGTITIPYLFISILNKPKKNYHAMQFHCFGSWWLNHAWGHWIYKVPSKFESGLARQQRSHAPQSRHPYWSPTVDQAPAFANQIAGCSLWNARFLPAPCRRGQQKSAVLQPSIPLTFQFRSKRNLQSPNRSSPLAQARHAPNALINVSKWIPSLFCTNNTFVYYVDSNYV